MLNKYHNFPLTKFVVICSFLMFLSALETICHNHTDKSHHFRKPSSLKWVYNEELTVMFQWGNVVIAYEIGSTTSPKSSLSNKTPDNLFGIE